MHQFLTPYAMLSTYDNDEDIDRRELHEEELRAGTIRVEMVDTIYKRVP